MYQWGPVIYVSFNPNHGFTQSVCHRISLKEGWFSEEPVSHGSYASNGALESFFFAKDIRIFKEIQLR